MVKGTMTLMTAKTLTALGCLAFGLALAGVVPAQEPRSDVIFDFSPDPAAVVLLVTYSGGTLGKYSVHTLFGDGRLEYRNEDNLGNVYDRRDFFLDYAKAKALVQIVVDHGLAESSTEDIIAKIVARSADHRMPHIVDMTDMILEVHLTTYRRAGQELGPIDREIMIHAGSYLARKFYPDIPELVGLSEIALAFDVYRKQAKELRKQEAEQAPQTKEPGP